MVHNDHQHSQLSLAVLEGYQNIAMLLSLLLGDRFYKSEMITS